MSIPGNIFEQWPMLRRDGCGVWQVKLVHKEEQKKFHGIFRYRIPIASYTRFLKEESAAKALSMAAWSIAGVGWRGEVSTTEKALGFPDELMAAKAIIGGSQDVIAHEMVFIGRCVVV
jgi:hypothetical protein